MTRKGDSEEEIRAVHYLKTDSWELERLYPPEAGSPPPEFGDRFAELLLSDVPTREEFYVQKDVDEKIGLNQLNVHADNRPGNTEAVFTGGFTTLDVHGSEDAYVSIGIGQSDIGLSSKAATLYPDQIILSRQYEGKAPESRTVSVPFPSAPKNALVFDTTLAAQLSALPVVDLRTIANALKPYLG